jgi:hypothetical protein
MDYDRLALLLLVRGSSRGFRKALKQSPAATLNKAGFNPGETAQLIATLNKIKATQPLTWKSVLEQQEVAFTFGRSPGKIQTRTAGRPMTGTRAERTGNRSLRPRAAHRASRRTQTGRSNA